MRALDLIIVVGYFAASIGIGMFYRSRGERKSYFQETKNNWGRAERVIIGLSLAATYFSGISFLMYPSMVLEFGLSVGLAVVPIFLGWVFLRYGFLPRFFRRQWVSSYAVIVERYGDGVHKVTCWLYVIYRLSWLATLIYAPTLVMLQMGRLPAGYRTVVILITGAICTAYTVAGGIRGVIATDVFQFFVMLTGIVAVFWFGVSHYPGDFHEGLASVLGNPGFTQVSFSLDPTATLTFWSLILGFVVPQITSYAADPMSLQRYIGLRTVPAASKAYLYNAAGTIAMAVVLIAIGVLLMIWRNGTDLFARNMNPDQMFPVFMVEVLPAGFSGLLLAALLAATMSSMTSGINGIAGLIYQALLNSWKSSTMSGPKMLSLYVGIAATGLACIVGELGTLFAISRKILGTISGPLLVPILLAVAGVRVRPIGIIIALIVGLTVGALVALSGWSSLWAAPMAVATSLLGAVITKLLLPIK